MKFIKVKWIHKKGEENEPIWLYSEIDNSRWETRRVEVFKDNKHKSYSQKQLQEIGLLGFEPYPELEFINSQNEFEGYEITKEEFEDIWTKAIKQNTKK